MFTRKGLLIGSLALLMAFLVVAPSKPAKADAGVTLGVIGTVLGGTALGLGAYNWWQMRRMQRGDYGYGGYGGGCGCDCYYEACDCCYGGYDDYYGGGGYTNSGYYPRGASGGYGYGYDRQYYQPGRYYYY